MAWLRLEKTCSATNLSMRARMSSSIVIAIFAFVILSGLSRSTLGFRRTSFISPGTRCYAADSFLTFRDLRFFSVSHKSLLRLLIGISNPTGSSVWVTFGNVLPTGG
jgi:hypothetical protein